MRAALERGDWDEVGRQIASEWDNRKRLAPGVTTPAIDDLIARAAAAGATAAKVCGAGGGGCLFCYGPPAARAAIAEALAARRRARARLPHRDGRPAAWITSPSRGSSGRSPTSSRSRTTTRSRSARTATAPTSSPTIRTSSRRSTTPALREIPGIGKDLAARIREIAEPATRAYHRELVAEFPPTILDLLHLQGVGPKTVATLYRELGIRTLDDLEQRGADGRIRALRGMGAKKEALILKALEERKRHAGRHLLPDAARGGGGARRPTCSERAPGATIDAGRQPAARLRDLRRPRHPRLRRRPRR